MTIFALIKEALRIARTHKSLWLFGFLVGVGGGGGGGGSGGFLGAEQDGSPAAATPPEPAALLVVGIVILAFVVTFVILKFLSTGALIEGVKRARSSGSMTIGEGFREGWAHWGVLFRIALVYVLVSFGSVALLAAPPLLMLRAFGSPEPAVFVAAGIAALVGVPWLLTLYMWQAFAERIAVLENRRALDAIAKARLFLHGRLHLGLKLLVAAFLGVLLVGAFGLLVIAPLVLLVVLLTQLWGLPALGLGVLTILPLAFVAYAFLGITTSSVWTIGYLTEVER